MGLVLFLLGDQSVSERLVLGLLGGRGVFVGEEHIHDAI
jgi:hypothetical protein